MTLGVEEPIKSEYALVVVPLLVESLMGAPSMPTLARFAKLLDAAYEEFECLIDGKNISRWRATVPLR